MKAIRSNRRGFIDALLAALLALTALLLPAVQKDKAYNRASAPGTEVISTR